MPPLLVVALEGAPAAPDWPGEVRYLDIRLDPAVPPHEVRELEAGPGRRRYAIHPQWQALAAGYDQQLLNRFFAGALIDWRPGAVLVRDLLGATLDLVRIAGLFACPAAMPVAAQKPAEARARQWLQAACEASTALIGAGGGERACADEAAALARLAARLEAAPPPQEEGFDYSLYEFAQRDPGLLYRMQLPYLEHFAGCEAVLDLACGAGIFLEALRQAGIPARGVERNPAAVRYARGLGHEVVESDALAFLETSKGAFDGIYCSHFVEHLPVEALGRLVQCLADALRPGGVLLLVFPDPESIRSQLLGFWRDPEHVRFYHPDLVELMCRAAGLQPEFHSQHRPERRVIPFPEQRPASAAPGVTAGGGLWDRLLAGLGLARQARLAALEQRLAALDRDVDTLWTVNQTWAWEDNAVLRLRKR